MPKLKSIPEALKIPLGAFVTLKKENELRGCIGYIESELPLIKTVQDAALKAAFNDPRFSPLEEEETPFIEIEISVLTPAHQISSIEEIEVGKHGLILQKGLRRGLLLPQVPVEHGWDRETFLQHTARKAGLPANAWSQTDAKLFIFSAEIFCEADFQ